MQAEIAALQVEFEVVKKAHAEGEEKLKNRIQQADQKVAELIKIIEEYKRATGRNAADFGVDMEQMRSQVMKIKGRLEVIEHRLANAEKSFLSVSEDVSEYKSKVEKDKLDRQAEEKKKVKEKDRSKNALDAIVRPKKRDDFYKLAYGLLDSGQYMAARTLFLEFLEKWPKGSYSDNALYWIGESYYAQNEFKKAAMTFQQVRQQFPKGDKAPDSLLKIGYCFIALGKQQQALPFLSEFVQSYPKNPNVAAAKKKISEVKKKIGKSKSK
jgi:tol-pal system protein YbgF